MDSWSVVWLVIFGPGALLFFGTALVITIAGSRDLKDLLSKNKRKKRSSLH